MMEELKRIIAEMKSNGITVKTLIRIIKELYKG